MNDEQKRIRGYLVAQAAKLSPREIVEKVEIAMLQLRAAASRGSPGGRPSRMFTMAPPKCRSASTTCAITSLALHSPGAGGSVKRVGGTLTAASRSLAMASCTLPMSCSGESLAPCAVR